MADEITPVSSLEHGASRANLPTAELESFVKDQDKMPTSLRYLRDPTLDPRLVWGRKDKRNNRGLKVPA